MPLQTDYATNDTLYRLEPQAIYLQITNDLKSAAGLLSAGYLFSGERIRVNAAGATALLSRIYLYTKRYQDCVEAASQVLAQKDKYNLCTNLGQTFLKNSQEAILQLQPVNPTYNTWEAETFILSSAPTLVAMANGLLGIFDSTDLRLQQWTNHLVSGGKTYFYSFKYRHKRPDPVQEYLMVLRIAELYLIRAEGYARVGDIEKSTSDLNTIRSRAGLLPLVLPDTGSIIKAIMMERQKELFTEWGHRWLDLKRTGAADSTLAPLKRSWSPASKLYPIPASEILLNPHLVQYTGY
jgi:hypothetical protein